MALGTHAARGPLCLPLCADACTRMLKQVARVRTIASAGRGAATSSCIIRPAVVVQARPSFEKWRCVPAVLTDSQSRDGHPAAAAVASYFHAQRQQHKQGRESNSRTSRPFASDFVSSMAAAAAITAAVATASTGGACDCEWEDPDFPPNDSSLVCDAGHKLDVEFMEELQGSVESWAPEFGGRKFFAPGKE